MVFKGNHFAPLVDDNGDNIKNLISRVSIKAEQLPSVVENQLKLSQSHSSSNNEGKIQQLFQNPCYHNGDYIKNNVNYDKKCISPPSSSFEDSSMALNGLSISSLDTTDDASSSSSSGALNDLSEIMSQSPVKRGLSKYYQGKSESFTDLSRVTSVEDLAKKRTTYAKRVKSRGNGLKRYKPYARQHPKPNIWKKNAARDS